MTVLQASSILRERTDSITPVTDLCKKFLKAKARADRNFGPPPQLQSDEPGVSQCKTGVAGIERRAGVAEPQPGTKESGMCRVQQILLFIFAAAILHGQITQLDLHFQSRDVDFSTANATKPFKSGATLPSICGVGEMFFNLTGPAGANLYGCTSLNAWTLQSSGSGGSGASMASQLGDFAAVRSSATVLAIGASCSVQTPCTARFGSLVYSFAAGGSVSITAGSGLAYVYVSSAGTLTVGHNLTASCVSGCVAQSGITGFPADAIPLFTWSATSGTWDASGGVDQRSVYSSKSIVASTGLTSAESSGKTVMAVDSTVVSLRTSVPPTAATACTAGTWALDTSFYYVCVSLNSWRRAAVAIW